jgi:acyl carrier protein
VTEREIYAGLTNIFHEAFGDDSIVLHSTTTAKDVPGWDSIKMVAIIIAVEAHFAIRLRAREIDQLQSVGDFVRLLEAKIPS